jgi:indolepyruvate ferredoxin oxidoreductase alpha subunit
MRHIEVEKRTHALIKEAAECKINFALMRGGELGVVTSGAVYQNVREALPDASVYKLGMVYPINTDEIKSFASKVKRLIVIEELEPYIQNTLLAAGMRAEGKNIFSIQGEIDAAEIRAKMLGVPRAAPAPGLPGRPPVLCPGCPHRSVFYVLSKLKLNVFGDIGCYTLGALKPLSAVDTTLCMGASIGMAAGHEKAEGNDRRSVAVIGDSTFVHSGITGLIDCVYNKTNVKVIILDNSTTGMTGHQPNPSTGFDIYNQPAPQLSLEAIAYACGASSVAVVDSFDMKGVEETLKRELSKDGVSVIIARRVCALLDKSPKPKYEVNERCVKCGACLKIGCPAISRNKDKTVTIDRAFCVGCGVCASMCRADAIRLAE